MGADRPKWMTEDTERRTRDAWARLREAHGRAPTATEMARETGVTLGTAVNRMQGLGLARTTLDKTTCAQIASAKRWKIARENGGRAMTVQEPRETPENVRRRRMNSVCAQPGDGPRNQRAGAEYAPGAVIVVPCACCGAPMRIFPRTHAHYIRRRDGTIAWLCMACDGCAAPGTYGNVWSER